MKKIELEITQPFPAIRNNILGWHTIKDVSTGDLVAVEYVEFDGVLEALIMTRIERKEDGRIFVADPKRTFRRFGDKPDP